MNVLQRSCGKLLPALLLLFLIFRGTDKSFAQKSYGKLNEETIALSRKTIPTGDQKTGAVILLRDYEVIIDKKDRKTIIIRVIGKLFNKQAIADYTQIPIPFNTYNEEANLDYARVIYNDGSIREISADAVQVKTSPDTRGGTQYTDNKYLTFTLSGLEPGVTFDYQVTIREKFGVFEGEWFGQHMFCGLHRSLYPPYTPRIDPVLDSRFVLKVPRGSEFRYYLTTGSIEPEKTTDNLQDQYKWELESLPAIQLEAAMPGLGSLYPGLILSSLKDWSMLNSWAYEKLVSRVEVTDEIKELADKLTASAKTTDEKIKSLAYYIQRNIQYVYADLERGGYVPHMAGDVLKSRYGDCKDQTILLISLLRAIGITAYPALITPYPFEENIEIPTIHFNHLITYLPLPDHELWLDMTSGVTPYPKLVFSDQNRTAFVINENGGKLTKTTGSNSEDNEARFDLKTSFSDKTTMIKIDLEASGVTSDLIKQILLDLKPEEREEMFRVFIRSYINNAEIDQIVVEDVHDPDQSFKASIQYHIDSIWSEGQKSFNFGSHAMLPLAFFANADIRSMPEKREHDIVIPFPYSIRGSETYIQPDDDLMPFLLPDSDSLESHYFRFQKSFTRSGSIVKVSWKFEMQDQTVPKTKYPVYYGDYNKLNELLAWNVLYLEPISLYMDARNEDTPQAILAFCRDALTKDNDNPLLMMMKGLAYEQMNMPDSSINIYSAILKKEPRNKYAHLLMSTPLYTMQKTEDAMKCIDKALQLDPNFIAAYAIRANVWRSVREYEKALNDYERMSLIDPQNAIVWKEKGFLLQLMGRYSEAASVLQKALEINPEDDWTHSVMASGYLEMGRYDKAMQSFQEAIRLNPADPDNYGNLGWLYYLTNNDQKCIEYSLKAIQLDPYAYYAKYNQALANLRLGLYEEAVKLYSRLAQEKAIPYDAKMGAIDDLIKLRQENSSRSTEAKTILKKYFGVTIN
ncbi:MAG: tetratricopeptide repeat protein [Bacteroidales bacterium]|nr:tetratricopeptide repeat protein [Bacteroidales bacterium]